MPGPAVRSWECPYQAKELLLRHTWKSGGLGPGLVDEGISIRISILKSPNPGGMSTTKQGTPWKHYQMTEPPPFGNVTY